MVIEDKYVPPVEVGDRLSLVCEGKGTQGDGMFKHLGMVIFVKDHSVVVDKEYDVKIVNVARTVAFGELI